MPAAPEREVSTLLPQEEETKKPVMTPRKSEKEKTQNLIKDMFFGKMAEKHEIVNLTGEKVEQSSESPFFQQVMNPKCGKFYEAWEESVVDEISDFRIDEHNTTQCLIRRWIKEIPSTLMFQIQRVGFDLKESQSEGLKHEFRKSKKGQFLVLLRAHDLRRSLSP